METTTHTPPTGLTITDLLDAIDRDGDVIRRERADSRRYPYAFGTVRHAVENILSGTTGGEDRLREDYATACLLVADRETFTHYEALAAARRDEAALAAS